MSNELFNRLEQKITSAVEALELLKMEAEELREENTRLKQEREEWERRLTGVLSKLDEIESTETA
ncbi:cell division protein ZapB [Halomonas sp.]|uniref:cell division protein ZapB n=1 Tax=Halomonas sp. TaxID=1486246 RepID=UPI0025BABD14|nr:cell division protein ZapB [Halomonas sp.]